MSREVGPRQILISLLAGSSWQPKSLDSVVKEMAEVAFRLSELDVTTTFVAHATNKEAYWSDDASYELGLLYSMGLVRFEANIVHKTDADYQDVFDFLCGDLDSDVRGTLARVAS